MNRQLILVKHSLPEIKKDLPAREWSLSEEGKVRAERLADMLKMHQLNFLAASKEPKAMETAQIIAARCGVDLRVLEGLHEHERSSVPYLSKLEFETAVRKFFERPDTLVFGDETANQAHERFSDAMNSILFGNSNSKIAVVTHGTVISLYVSRLTGQTGFEIWSRLGLPSFVVLDIESNELIALENIS